MAARPKKATTKPEEKPVDPQPTTEDPPKIDAVIVVRQKTETGFKWAVGELLGEVTPDQVPTGLRLAAKGVDERLGIAN